MHVTINTILCSCVPGGNAFGSQDTFEQVEGAKKYTKKPTGDISRDPYESYYRYQRQRRRRYRGYGIGLIIITHRPRSPYVMGTSIMSGSGTIPQVFVTIYTPNRGSSHGWRGGEFKGFKPSLKTFYFSFILRFYISVSFF